MIPNGISPGQSFHIKINGKIFQLVCPPGHGPGHSLMFEIDPPPSVSATNETVPKQEEPAPMRENTEIKTTDFTHHENVSKQEEHSPMRENTEKKTTDFTHRSRSLSQLHREGKKKEWEMQALKLLSDELKNDGLNHSMDVDGPKLLQISIDLLRGTNPTPTQQVILKHLDRLCGAWKSKHHSNDEELPKELRDYVEPARSDNLLSFKSRLIQLQTPFESNPTDPKSRDNFTSLIPQVQTAISKEIWKQLSSDGTHLCVYSLRRLSKIMLFTNTRYNKVYKSIVKGIERDDQEAFEQLSGIADSISKSCVQTSCRQTTEDALDLIAHAVQLKVPFENLLEKLSSKVSGTFNSVGPVKKLYRLIEKTALRQENVTAVKDGIQIDFKFGKVCDVRRGYIQSMFKELNSSLDV